MSAPTGKIKAANIDRSRRLSLFLGALASGEWRSTMDIIREAGICAVNSCAAECRAQGIDVACERRGAAWYYRLPCRRAA